MVLYCVQIIKMKISIFFISLIPFLLFAQIQSPTEFLGYELGDQFTRHHQVVDYFNHLAQSDKVKLIEYGKTYENRPLILAFISTEKNIENLESIRLDNLKRAGIEDGDPTNEVAIVWLSYNVHGNESSATEASIATAYELIKEGDGKSAWLENTVVIIDPCLNPDGRDRYVNFYWQYGNQPYYNPDPSSLEHNEVWPGGRPNHYLFDLNRDWAWQTQVETQSRIKIYNQWLPQIHVDFHEQYINSPYYFAPAAKPFHELITPFQREFQVQIGKNHARYFDENNWFYFTKQFFDLLYPSYGDTYPTYNGSIGMTYEQAGHGRAGLGIIKQEGDTLTLKDRIAHHHTTGLSTVEVASNNTKRLLGEFESFFGNKNELKYKTFVLKHPNNPDKMKKMQSWLDSHGITYGSASSSKGLRGYDFRSGRNKTFSINREDLVISMDQPKATLAHILFEPKTTLEDSVTYDITAWAAPYSFGFEAYASDQLVSVSEYVIRPFQPIEKPAKAYAFISKWNSLEDARFLSKLLLEGVKVRFTEKPIEYKGKSFGRGSLVVSKRDNKSMSDFEGRITELANQMERSLDIVTTGFMDKGPDLGSGDIKYLKKPSIALLGWEGTSSLSFGSTWYYMEQELGYPVTTIGTDYFKHINLDEYEVLIMPNGWYGSFGEGEMKKITEWISKGGKLIAIGSAINKFKDSEYASLSEYNSEDEKSDSKKRNENREKNARLNSYEDREREFTKNSAPGAIYRVKVDPSHPLAFGYGDTYYTLKTSRNKVAYMNDGNVGVINNASDKLSGFSGQYTLEDTGESLVFGVEEKGQGQIIYFVDDPLFRSFWQNGKLLFANALFFVGQ